MDKTVPAGAALLLDFIGDIEAPQGYNTIYGNNQGKLPRPVTRMTVDEVLRAQPGWSKRFGSSATGRYQFMYATLKELRTELGLGSAQLLDADLQDRLAYHLLKRRGFEAYVTGRINRVEFGKRLAQEWASLPVLMPTRGAHRDLQRGQSYYEGDKLNKSLVKPEKVETVLAEALAPDARPAPAPYPPRPIPSIPGPVSEPMETELPDAPLEVPPRDERQGNWNFAVILFFAAVAVCLAILIYVNWPNGGATP